MKYISQKVKDGSLNISNVSRTVLIQWSQETDSLEDKDVLGCEIMYRKG